MPKRKEITDRVTALSEGETFGEYVRKGETYTVTYPKTRRGMIYFRQEERGSGTMMTVCSFLRAIERGNLEIIAA